MGNRTSSRIGLVEYIRRKTSALTRKDSNSTYFSSNLNIADPRKRHINLGIMSNREHLSIYIYNHISVTCRKAHGLVYAIVWTATIVSILDTQINERDGFQYDMILMICITIFATYLGMKFTDIKTKYAEYSNAEISKRFIQAYHQDVLDTKQNIADKFDLE